jgi:hypothetical protein
MVDYKMIKFGGQVIAIKEREKENGGRNYEQKRDFKLRNFSANVKDIACFRRVRQREKGAPLWGQYLKGFSSHSLLMFIIS